MHRGRFGGNARKRKTRLTDATFHAMIGSPIQGEAQIMAVIQETSLLEVVETDQILLDEPLGSEPAAQEYIPFVSAAAYSAAHVHRAFACKDYEFGYAMCPTCRNDQAYYVHHEDLQSGYSFRCRVCRHEMTVTGKA